MQFPRSRVQYLCELHLSGNSGVRSGVRHGFPTGQQRTFPELLHLVLLLAG
jgi:hypothetical protein